MVLVVVGMVLLCVAGLGRLLVVASQKKRFTGSVNDEKEPRLIKTWLFFLLIQQKCVFLHHQLKT